MSKTFWRVDTRPFADGEEILPAKNYQDAFNDDGKKTEALFEEQRPANKPVRASALFLFEELEDALFYASKKTAARLYLVSADDGDILHRGDMTHIDTINKHFTDGQEIGHEVADYWSGAVAAKPCMEVLATKAVVLSERHTSERELHTSYYRGHGQESVMDESDEDFDKRIGLSQ